ncbi:MAG: hypothetical protein K8T90_01295 [Planctomycetes bacterium]|nr:hypothetical protein [Planctomycetota bacterium]
MSRPMMQPGEEILARDGVQLARGFPQTAGDLFLTNRRLVLLPNQFMSLGFGKSLEVPLERVREIKAHGRFQGGTLVGGAGRKVEIVLDDGTRHTFSFFLNGDPAGFLAALERCHSPAATLVSPPPIAAQAAHPFPKPRRTVWFWLSIAVVFAAAAVLIHDLVGLYLGW